MSPLVLTRHSSVATEAIDRLHSTAHSHHRIIVVEIMGNKAGWLALGAGIAGGADVILIPEIPYDVESIADAIRSRSHRGKRFSLVAVAEGAISKQDVQAMLAAEEKVAKAKSRGAQGNAKAELARLETQHAGNTMRLAKQLEKLTGLESRVTILGYLQRGGTPSAGGSAARHTAGHRLCRPHQQESIRGHRWRRAPMSPSPSTRGCRQKAEICPARSPVGRHGAPGRNLLGRLDCPRLGSHLPSRRLLNNQISPRLLKRVQMQGGAPILWMGTRGRVRRTSGTPQRVPERAGTQPEAG